MILPSTGQHPLERFHCEWNRRNNLSLRGAQRRSNPLPDERNSAREAGDCFGAARLAMTVSTHGANALGIRFSRLQFNQDAFEITLFALHAELSTGGQLTCMSLASVRDTICRNAQNSAHSHPLTSSTNVRAIPPSVSRPVPSAASPFPSARYSAPASAVASPSVSRWCPGAPR